MATQSKIIGRVPVSRLEYVRGATYYRDNITTLYGSAFQCAVDSTTTPPATLDASGKVTLGKGWIFFADTSAISNVVADHTVKITKIEQLIGEGYTFMGVATPETNPGTPDQKVFYIANIPGSYVNFDNINVDSGEVAIFKYDENWQKLESGVLSNFGAFEIFKKGIKFADVKKTIDDNSYFENIFQKGLTYNVKNNSSSTCSFIFFDDNKHAINQVTNYIEPNKSISFTFNENNCAWFGGWVNSYTYSLIISIVPISAKIIDDQQTNINERQYAQSELTSFDLRNGYIHANASKGFFPSDLSRCTYPIFVNKGSKIIVKYKAPEDSLTVISRTNSDGTKYESLVTSGEGIQKYGYAVFEYDVIEDMYVCLCGKAEWFHAEIERAGNYATKNDLELKNTFNCAETWQKPFKFKKGHRYLIKNIGANNTSCFTRFENDGDYGKNGGLIDKIVSEQTKDQVIPSLLNANSWAIFIASEDANYIVGYLNGTTKIHVEDIGKLNAINNEYKTDIINRYHNVIFQSREGRVSSVLYPNNTKYGIKEAARNQYDRIRFTIRKTTDGVFFLCHNDTINSVARNKDGSIITNNVLSSGITLEELNTYDWGILYGEKYKGMQVPLLEDAVYYASLYNLAVTYEINFEPTEEDAQKLFSLAVKYGILNSLIIVGWYPILNTYFRDRSKKVSFEWGGYYDTFKTQKEMLKTYLTGENNVYIYNYPYNEYPSQEYLEDMCANGFTPHYTDIFNKEEFYESIKKGMVLIDVANVPFIKSTLREYADSLID